MNLTGLAATLFRWMPTGLYLGLRRYWNVAELAWLESPVASELAPYIPEGGVVIDAGAAIGMFTKFFSRGVGPQGRVYAIEPMQVSYDALVTAKRVFGWQNVVPIHAAVSDTVGRGWMQPASYPGGAPNYYEPRLIAKPAEGASEVAITTIDALELPRLDFLKIDVEEHEIPVLRGAGATIARCRPVLYVEVWSQEARDLTLSFGYRVVYDDSEHGNILCVPNERS